MLAEDPGEGFINDLVSRPIQQHQISKNQDIPKTEDFDAYDSQFTIVTINSVMAKDIYQNPGMRLNNVQVAKNTNGATVND